MHFFFFLFFGVTAIPYILSFRWYGYLLPASVWLNVKVHFIFIFRVMDAFVCLTVSLWFYWSNFAVSFVRRQFSSHSKRDDDGDGRGGGGGGGRKHRANVETFLNVHIDWAIQSNNILSEAFKRAHAHVYNITQIKSVYIRATRVRVCVFSLMNMPEHARASSQVNFRA